jgi:signal peptidase II
MRERPNGAWLPWLLVSAATVALDLATKRWISTTFRTGQSIEVTPFFNLVLAHNPGAAFSFLAGAGGWQRWFFTGITIVISMALVVMLRRQHRNPLLSTAFTLVLGGALGNLYDRLTLGYVVDFIQLHWGEHYFPAFNIADSAISIGVALLLWDSLRPHTRPLPVDRVREEKP